MTAPLTHHEDGVDRSGKLCRCNGCGLEALCLPEQDFYTVGPRPFDGKPLLCVECFAIAIGIPSAAAAAEMERANAEFIAGLPRRNGQPVGTRAGLTHCGTTAGLVAALKRSNDAPAAMAPPPAGTYVRRHVVAAAVRCRGCRALRSESCGTADCPVPLQVAGDLDGLPTDHEFDCPATAGERCICPMGNL